MSSRNMARRIAAAVLAVWLAAWPAQARAEKGSYKILRDVVYVARDGGPLKADVYRPLGEGPFPGVLCVHGGAWISGNKSQMAAIARRLAQAGCVAVSINYRLAPKHKFPAQIEDCRAALRWMRSNAPKQRIDRERLGAWGYSAGGHLVALLGTTEAGLKAVVAGGAPCDFRQLRPQSRWLVFWLGGTRGELPDVYEAASPAHFVSADDPPFFFYHGGRDHLVKIEQPRAMAEALDEAGVTAKVHVIRAAGHVAAFLDRGAMDEAIEFLRKRLWPAPASTTAASFGRSRSAKSAPLLGADGRRLPAQNGAR